MAALRFFEDEFIAHIDDKICPAGQCKPLVRAKCINACPAGVDSPAYLALVAQGRYAEGPGDPPPAQPVRADLRARLPGLLRAASAAAARSTSRSPSAWSSASWPTRSSQNPWTPEPLGRRGRKTRRQKVAVIGAGPAGLTAALRLAQTRLQR